VQVLRDMITSNGGLFHAYLDTKGLVTHVVASNLTGVKVHQLKHMKIVRPEWIVDSIKQGLRLPWQDYRLETTSRVDAAQGSKTGQQSLFQATQGVLRGQTQVQSLESQAEEANPERTESTTPTSYLGASSPSKLVEDDGDPSEVIYMTDPVTLEQAKRIPGYALHASNQAAQRLMQNPEWRDAHTAVAGKKFIEGYYQNSRLHHLSTWKAELRLLVAQAQEKVESGEFAFASKDETLASVAGDRLSMRGAEITKEWSKSSSKDKGKGKAAETQKTIMHCDFDCFFVSAGLVDRPELRGKPTVVCHSQGNGEGAASTSEIASCSYEARAKGIKNGMR
jgi:DNA repair protein REV1